MAAAANPLTINLALQGGGAHGAFTWGVLDRLLEEPGLAVEGISGTSAGAMNAAVLAQGYARGGPDGARAALDRFWTRIGDHAVISPIRRTWIDRLLGRWNVDASPTALMFDLMVRLVSPYQANPLGLSPLRGVLEETIDFSALAAPGAPKLFVSTTNARTGELHVFAGAAVTADVLLASACLPFLFHAVEIGGDPHWDGGYTANPALAPLIRDCTSPDMVVVKVNPVRRDGTPRTAAEIMNRVNEVSFNAAILQEMRTIEAMQSLLDDADVAGNPTLARIRAARIHVVAADEELADMGVASKMNPEPDFLHHLKALGRARADGWLRETRGALGRRSTAGSGSDYVGACGGRPAPRRRTA
ncbi:patatin-like phospholipase family protein [Azospirillum halopraeferens]|uniref:patatin-like phospholipase family protein n=1 Tax=Azospirillum halopraeferens TaxID=34010 RepID=UPI00041FA31B|nr:patatin-like phospholipase family protein [Azospirillum halopraeferens]